MDIAIPNNNEKELLKVKRSMKLVYPKKKSKLLTTTRKIKKSILREIPNVIMPDTKFRRIWEVTITIMVSFQGLYIPYVVSFDPEQSNEWKLFDMIVDGIFMIDLCL